MRSKGRKSVFIVAIATLILFSLLIFSSVPGSPIASFTSPISFLTDPIQKIITGFSSNVGGFFSSIKDSERIRKENEVLLAENARLEMQLKELEENGRRWEELKSAFKIRDLFSDYELIGASVLTREIGDWFDIFRISAGTREGITIDEKTSYAVVDPQMNLVGRVYSSDFTSAKILPILNEGSIISAKLNTAGGAVVRVRGDVLLKEEGFCLIDNISDFSAINIGDEVITSGLGGLYPPGIPIGTIVELRNNDQKIEKTAVLKVYANYRTLKDMFVMKGKSSD
ncbi:MAG: rod shape-determining protein MreC [Saccharofermentanales bacterium]